MATDLFLKILLKLKQFENFRQRVIPFLHTENDKKSIHLWRDFPIQEMIHHAKRESKRGRGKSSS